MVFSQSYPELRRPADTESSRKQFFNQVVAVVNNIMRGKTNLRGSLTMGAGTTTTINNPNLHGGSIITLMATNSAASAITGIYASSRGNGTVTLTHSVAVGTETFDWCAHG